MAVLNIYNLNGDVQGTLDVKDEVFGIEPNKSVLHEVLKAELAGARQGTASTKTRSMVRGGGRKPFKQKGTGRARQGTIRAPHMVGGGVVFGPSPRSYEQKVNKKVRQLAIKSALAVKAAKGELVVLDEKCNEIKTKSINNFAKKIEAKTKQMFVVNDLTDTSDYNLYLSARNIKSAIVLQPNELGVYWLLKQEKVIMTREAIKTLEEVLG